MGNVTPLEMLLLQARARDTLSLWHLLSRVEGRDRALVYDRMAALVPPPAGVTREGVLQLNEPMLQTWKEKLVETWSADANGGVQQVNDQYLDDGGGQS